ncbi:hypothetical protein KHO57_gp063 [Mycobacterium phage Phabba]|uniref:Lipoprotein n=1 Tax=Mycobacterium phage Phabba TaxID=2027899 RepID=A0A249XSE1_9CAUD|nr:hypothetical protein KHO57_gp063 [Mycobacterium phage Phabba]ASZ74638.1 hypothetical protein SEA_PHABBA_63 [Mycobacterium phage Phabba]
MKKMILGAAALALILTGCGDAQSQGGEERFNVTRVTSDTGRSFDCVTWLPYDGTGDGGSMQCLPVTTP